MTILNAKIKYTTLGFEDHGILTCWLHLDYTENSGQGFGGYGLDNYSETAKKRIPHVNCGLFIQRVLEVVGVDEWEKLKGQYVRVRIENGLVVAIGNILQEDWFYPKEELVND